jgi:elongation factor 1-beta
MGQVAAVHVLTSEDNEFNFDKVAKEIASIVPPGIKVVRAEVKPLAFGLKMLEVTTIMQDSEGFLESLENAYAAIPGIAGVEAKEVGLI